MLTVIDIWVLPGFPMKPILQVCTLRSLFGNDNPDDDGFYGVLGPPLQEDDFLLFVWPERSRIQTHNAYLEMFRRVCTAADDEKMRRWTEADSGESTPPLLSEEVVVLSVWPDRTLIEPPTTS